METYKSVVVEDNFHLEFFFFVNSGLAVNAHVLRTGSIFRWLFTVVLEAILVPIISSVVYVLVLYLLLLLLLLLLYDLLIKLVIVLILCHIILGQFDLILALVFEHASTCGVYNLLRLVISELFQGSILPIIAIQLVR